MTKCVWASQDERGGFKNGAAGDQTGREVKVGNYYQFGQSMVFRFKDRALAKEYAACMKYLATIEPDGDTDGDMDGCVGYDQVDRLTLADELERLDWNYMKLRKKVETDCSAMTAAGLNCVGIKVPKNWYTGNMEKSIMATGKFTKLTDSRYLKNGDYLKTGDIVLDPHHHVITVIEDGTLAEKDEEKKEEYVIGKNYTLQKNMNVRTGAGTNYIRKKREDLTSDGKRHSLPRKYGVLKKGTVVTCINVAKSSNGTTWMRIPSGWVCAKGKTKTYIK